MNPVDIIGEYYKPGSEAYAMLLQHGKSVARKALDAAAKVPSLNPDITLIHEAAMLHDIAVFMTDAPELHCTGKHPATGIWAENFLKAKDISSMPWYANGTWESA